MVMEKSWNMKRTRFCDQSWNFTDFDLAIHKVCPFFSDIRKRSKKFALSNCEHNVVYAKSELSNRHGKLRNQSWKSHGQKIVYTRYESCDLPVRFTRSWGYLSGSCRKANIYFIDILIPFTENDSKMLN